MAFRRSVPFRRRSFKRRSRSLQTPHMPRKWERGNFYLPVEHDHSNDLDLLTVIPIAQVINIADGDSTATGRSLSQAVRHLEVGGVVYNAFFQRDNESGFEPPAQGDNGSILCRLLLCSDRLDSSQPPQPAALTTNWFTNTQPVTGLAELQDEQAQFPTQIHHQHARILDFGDFDLLSVAGSVPRGTVVEQTRATGNVRLRLRLSDQEVLAWHIASHIQSPEGALGLSWRCVITGTIFYRYVFGAR